MSRSKGYQSRLQVHNQNVMRHWTNFDKPMYEFVILISSLIQWVAEDVRVCVRQGESEGQSHANDPRIFQV